MVAPRAPAPLSLSFPGPFPPTGHREPPGAALRWASIPPTLDTTADFYLERYLVPFDLRQVPHYSFDVVVLGSGAAGSAVALSAADEGASVGLLSKSALTDSNTQLAQGGMAAVLAAPDTFESHVADTLEVGCGLCEREVVEHVVRGGPGAVQRLAAVGAHFDRGGDGSLELSNEGGHSHHRVVHASDATGREIQRCLTQAVAQASDVATFPNVFALDLLSDPDGRVVGVLCRTVRGELVAFQASQVVLATGGAGQIYRETTNPTIATADGVAMGVRAGCRVRDLEFVQFHPTCLYIAGAARVLISEVVRGAGGVLRDRHGVRFMPDHHPAAELAPRDVVSRVVFERMVATNDTSVFLDLSGLDHDPHEAFPHISRICRFFGIDIARDPIPVRPGCHYLIGGLDIDLQGRTSVPGLWAAGECASSGLHGANRMGSNSLLEAMVLGEDTGRATARAVDRTVHIATVHGRSESPSTPPAEVNIDDLTYSLKALMWRQLGVERSGEGMDDALEKLRFWRRAVRALPLEGPRSWELANMLTVAHLITLGAQGREESRGVHHRLDRPRTEDDWRVHLTFEPVVEAGIVRAVRSARVALPEAIAST